MLNAIYRPQGYSREERETQGEIERERQGTQLVSRDEHGAQSETNENSLSTPNPDSTSA